MSDKTSIEWTRGDDGTPGATWNPLTGCTKVTPGCDNCYAETFAERWRGTPGHYFEQGFDVVLRPDKLDQPLRWRKPRRIFVNSMSDLFHDAVPDEYIARVFAVMSIAGQHTYQLLTKRHGRMRSLLSSPDFRRLVADTAPLYAAGNPDLAQDNVLSTWPLPNVWLGVSVEDQKRADLRIPALLDTPAAVRWLSCEPLLGPVDLTPWLDQMEPDGHEYSPAVGNVSWYRPRLGWVVVGGESGRAARPMHPDWARSLRDQCTGADVPFFFKQWGEWAPNGQRGIGNVNPRERLVGKPDDRGFREVIERVGKKAASRELDGRTWDEYPTELAGASR